MAEEVQDHGNRIAVATAAAIPHLGANGFAVGMGTGDIVISLEQNGVPVATVNCSFTVTKTLAMLLGNVIADLERMSGRTIMTTKEIEKMIQEKQAGGQADDASSKRRQSVAKKKRAH